jgi:exodeoxyribonuclease III
MRIATFNVNGIGSRLPALLQWLEEKQPDVACLQELKAPQEKFPLAAINAAGYHAIWHGQKSWNGVAILSRTPAQEIGRGLPGDPDDEQSRYIEAVVNDVVIACLYLPNGNPAPGPKFDYKLKWFERLIRRGEQLLATGAKVVLAGDFNVMPTELDVYKPERWGDDALFRPETREAFHRLVAQGWTDSLRTMHPGEKIYTFWDYFRNAYGRDAGLRIDHLLLSPALAPALKAAGVDRDVRGREKPSDHAPTWIELDLAAAHSAAAGSGTAATGKAADGAGKAGRAADEKDGGATGKAASKRTAARVAAVESADDTADEAAAGPARKSAKGGKSAAKPAAAAVDSGAGKAAVSGGDVNDDSVARPAARRRTKAASDAGVAPDEAGTAKAARKAPAAGRTPRAKAK